MGKDITLVGGLTIGLDLGDKHTVGCVLTRSGEVEETFSAATTAEDHEESGLKRGGRLERSTDVTKATWRRMKGGRRDGAGLLMEEMSAFSSGPQYPRGHGGSEDEQRGAGSREGHRADDRETADAA